MKCSIMSFILVLLISHHSFAQGITPVKDLLDNYTFAMEVEWDQTDKDFQKNQEELMLQGIRDLIQQGVSSQELLKEVLQAIPDKRFKSDIMNHLTLANQTNMHPEELQTLLLQSAQEARMQWAQWSPVVKVVLGVAITLLVARIALEIYFHEWEKRF
jgi:CRISPR/Cas system Type II protein with McrA/HNH and RuvC-like nuclease domain